MSIGSERAGLITYLEGRGAAGFIFTSEPERPPDPASRRRHHPTDAALAEGLHAATGLKNVSDVEAIVATYIDTFGRQPFDLPLIAAARMAVGAPVDPDAGPGSAVLDLVPDLAPTEAAALCKRVRESDPNADDQELLGCEARSTSRAAVAAGDLLAAQRALEHGYDAQQTAGVQPDPALLLEAAHQAEARDDLAGAQALELRAASFESTSAAAFSRLSQLAFRRDDSPAHDPAEPRGRGDGPRRSARHRS